jgi:hypothetical protein
MTVVIMIAAVACAYRVFRRAMGESIDQATRRIVRDAEKLAGYRRPALRWVRPALATAVAWAAMSFVLTPVHPTIAVWVGGAMVFVGTAAVVRAVPGPGRIHPDDLDRALIELLEGTG